MPAWLDASALTAALRALDRPTSAVVLIIALSMLVAGMRWFRAYVALWAAAAGWVLGLMLARLMHVRGWYVGVPSAAFAASAGWFLVHPLRLTLLAVVGGCCMGAFVQKGLELEAYWAGFVFGALAALGLGALAPRFSAALLCAGVGSATVIMALGQVVRAASGPFALGGVARYPVAFLAAGMTLFVFGMVAQVALEPPSDDIA